MVRTERPCARRSGNAVPGGLPPQCVGGPCLITAVMTAVQPSIDAAGSGDRVRQRRIKARAAGRRDQPH